MTAEYISKNISLLQFIKVDINLLMELYNILQYSSDPRYKECVKAFLLNKDDFSFDNLTTNQLCFLNTHYNLLIKNTSLKHNLLNSNIFQENPNLFSNYFINISHPEVFLLLKRGALYKILTLLETKYISSIIKHFSEITSLNFINYLIETKHPLLFAHTFSEIKKQFDFFSKFTFLPKEIEIYIKDTNSFLLSKIKKENDEEELLSKLLNKPNLIINFLKTSIYTDEFKNILFSNIDINIFRCIVNGYKKEFLSLLPEKLSNDIFIELSTDEITQINFDQNILDEYFVNNIYRSLSSMSLISEFEIKKHFNEIRTSILENKNVGKQGLKYFLIKNRRRIDKELADYVLKIYPRFYNSLKIEHIISKQISFLPKMTLTGVISKKELSLEELEFVESNIEKLLKINFDNVKRINPVVKNLILKFFKQ